MSPIVLLFSLLPILVLLVVAASSSSSSSSTSTTSTTSTTSSSSARKPRKCGECGQEGHDRRNCPQLSSDQVSQAPPKRQRTLNPSPRSIPFDPNATFVVFDCETTGLSPRFSRMVQFSFRELKADGTLTENRLSRFVNPGFPINDRPLVHQGRMVTQAHVEEAPPFFNAGREIVEWITMLGSNVILIAHNAAFDLRFLIFEMEKASLELPPNIKGVSDPLLFIRKHFKEKTPAPSSFREETLYEFICGKQLVNPHFADRDVDALCEILLVPPFLSLAKSNISPLSLYLDRWERLKELWKEPTPTPDPYIESDNSESEENDEGEEANDNEEQAADGVEGPLAHGDQQNQDTWQKKNFWSPALFTGPPPGPTKPPNNLPNSFLMFYSPLRPMIVRETNLYAKQKRACKTIKHFLTWATRERLNGTPFKPIGFRHWSPLSGEELDGFFAILIIAGVNQRESSLSDMWSSNPAIGNAKVKSIMSYSRLLSLSSSLSLIFQG